MKGRRRWLRKIIVLSGVAMCTPLFADDEHIADDSQRKTFKMDMTVCLPARYQAVNDAIVASLREQSIDPNRLSLFSDRSVFTLNPSWKRQRPYLFLGSLYQNFDHRKYNVSFIFGSDDHCQSIFENHYLTAKDQVENNIAPVDFKTKIKKITPRVESLVRASFFMLKPDYKLVTIKNQQNIVRGFYADIWATVFEIDQDQKSNFLYNLNRFSRKNSLGFLKIWKRLIGFPTPYLAMSMEIDGFLSRLSSYDRLALQAPIARGHGFSVLFGLNAKDGLAVDQYFKTILLTKEGVERKMGLVRISNVGKGLSTSTARVIRGPGSTAEGMLLRQIYTPNNNFTFQLGSTAFKRSKGSFPGLYEMIKLSEVKGFIPAFSFTYERDLGAWFDIADMPIVAEFSSQMLSDPMSVTRFGLGLKKRYYFWRLALFARAMLSIGQITVVDPRVKDISNVEDSQNAAAKHRYKASQVGGSLSLGGHFFVSRYLFVLANIGYASMSKITTNQFTNTNDVISKHAKIEVDNSGYQGFLGLSINL